jgi:hypothetical protein
MRALHAETRRKLAWKGSTQATASAGGILVVVAVNLDLLDVLLFGRLKGSLSMWLLGIRSLM